MKLVVGLGNPGPEYRDTRHSVGFKVVDVLADRHRSTFGSALVEALVAKIRVAAETVILAKPLTFMNRSGQAVAALRRYYRLELAELLIVADDVNLPFGRLRARPDGSAGGHNGLKSVIEALGSEEFPRVRIGIGRGDDQRELVDHVLSRFEPDERPLVPGLVASAADAVEMFVTDGIEQMMNRFNRKVPESD
ncbi:MAG: aminoacyl-tRNA hydrolase [Acidobacteria bacterium]|nr:aminoacyl-tRNA hydrolase [Acidobacteriota bacterium]